MFLWLILIITTSLCVKNKLKSKYSLHVPGCKIFDIIFLTLFLTLCRATSIYFRYWEVVTTDLSDDVIKQYHKLGQHREIILENEFLFIVVSEMILLSLILKFEEYDVLHFFAWLAIAWPANWSMFSVGKIAKCYDHYNKLCKMRAFLTVLYVYRNWLFSIEHFL